MDLLTINDPSGEHPNSYYFASRNKINNFSPLKDNLSCDVCVIGGGFTGLSTAIRLKERGFSVVLLEARRVGFGASGRNGGQVGVGQHAGSRRHRGRPVMPASRAQAAAFAAAGYHLSHARDQCGQDHAGACELGFAPDHDGYFPHPRGGIFGPRFGDHPD